MRKARKVRISAGGGGGGWGRGVGGVIIGCIFCLHLDGPRTEGL